MTIQHLPNIITFLRLLLIAPFAFALLSDYHKTAFILFLVAGISDGFDGFLARRYHCVSKMGSFLDPLSDKLLMVTSFAALTWEGELTVWVMVIMVMRDLVIMCGATAFYYVFGHIHFKPLFVSKVNTVLQIILIIVLLFQRAFFVFPSAWTTFLIGLVLTTTLISLFHYVWFWSCRAFREWV